MAGAIEVYGCRIFDFVAVGNRFFAKDTEEAEAFLCACLDSMAYQERWALLKFWARVCVWGCLYVPVNVS